MMHPLIKHARFVISSHLSGKNWRDTWQGPQTRPSKGCFVSLKKGRRLRGCIGTLEPVRPSLEEEIASNALSAALRDPRFPPLGIAELEKITITIDILEPPEAVASSAALNPARYGVVVRHGRRYGVLLPGIPGVDSVEKQLRICLEKANIKAEEPYAMSRFTVTRLGEEND